MITKFIKNIFLLIFSTVDKRVAIYLKCICYCKRKKLNKLGVIISHQLQRVYGVFISFDTVFDETLTLFHPTGIVIGEGVEIGQNVKIYQNVTLGRADLKLEEYPVIGDNTIIYCGSVVLGGVRVGNDCIIGANAVVTKDIPNNSVAMGNPAKFYAR
jgi:serine O-acetyltransferase